MSGHDFELIATSPPALSIMPTIDAEHPGGRYPEERSTIWSQPPEWSPAAMRDSIRR